MSAFRFELHARCPASAARRATFHTPHGAVETPQFMPVGTRGTVKGVLPEQLRTLGASMILCNTYHLHLRPGEALIEELGGLHRFMNWDGPILTDSGGYQVFSLGALAKISDEGVKLRSVVDGSALFFTPERVIEIEQRLGADVIMAFDHCASDPLAHAAVEDAVERTRLWLARCVHTWRARGGSDSGRALFGIVQGGVFPKLRQRSAEDACAHDLPGYAIGGVSVGEQRVHMLEALDASVALLPEHKPRYLMGVGTPEDFLEAVERGIDLFDCVTPTRNGRNHQAFTSRGRLNLRNACHARQSGPLEEGCDCSACTGFSRAYLRHLAQSGEMLGSMLITLHNLRYFARLMEQLRAAIPRGEFPALKRELLARLQQGATEDA